MYLDVIADARNLTRDFCNNDYVVIVAGTSNIESKNDLEMVHFDKIVSSLAYTNVIIVTVPLSYKSRQYNNDTIGFNTTLCNYCLERKNLQSLVCLDINRHMRRTISYKNSIYMTNSELNRVACAIVDKICFHYRKVGAINESNLIYVKVTNSGDEREDLLNYVSANSTSINDGSDERVVVLNESESAVDVDDCSFARSDFLGLLDVSY